MQAQAQTPMSHARRSLFLLNVIIFLMSAAFYTLYPLLANQLISLRKIAVILVNLVISVRILSQDLLMLPANLLLERLGARAVIAICGIARGMGFILITLTDSIPLLMVSAILIGVGGALFFPATHLLYTQLTNETTRLTVFARRERLNSVGAVVGPLFGTLLLRFGFACVGIVSGGIFIALSLFLLLVPEGRAGGVSHVPIPAVDLRALFRNRPFLWYTVASMLIMQLCNQVGMAPAVRINQIQPDYAYIGLISSLSSAVMVVSQVPLLKLMNRHLSLTSTLCIAAGLYMAGFLAFGLLGSIAGIYFAAVLCCIGTVLYMPTRDAMLSTFSGEQPSGAYYGVQGIANTFGNLLIAPALGALYDIPAESAFRMAPWLVLPMGGLLAIFILRRLATPVRPETMGQIVQKEGET